MAYDFPNSPTPGQVFQKWTWNGEAWVLTAPSEYTKAEADAKFVDVAGDTMTGHLALPTGPGAANAVRKDYVDAGDTAATNLANTKVAKAGDTMTGHLTLPTGPAAANAVRKDYVDAAVGSVDLSSRVARAGDTMTGTLNSRESLTINTGGSAGTFEVGGNTSTNWAAMTFHVHGAFATNFGLNVNGNFYFGGWSHGSSVWQFWTSRDFSPSSYLSNGRLPYAGDQVVAAFGAGTYGEPIGHGLHSGYAWQSDAPSGYNQIVTGFRYRYVQGYTTGWFTFAYA